MKNLQCPCCGYYTIIEHFDICKVCFWQFDLSAHNRPDKVSGANRITLNEARKNYKKYGASEEKWTGEEHTRPPLPEELPENNQ